MFARSVAKSIAKRAVRLSVKPASPLFRHVPSACFSNIHKLSEQGSLNSLIRQEIEFENGNVERDGEYEDIKKIIEKSFKIHQEPGKGEVRLTRTHEDQKIEVFFHVQDVSDSPNFEEQDGESDEEPFFGVNFRVDITQGDKKLSVSAVGGQELDVREIRFLPAGIQRNDEEGFYGGPDFSDLEEGVQEGFLDYLEERKIDGDLAFFVLAHAREKEQKEYINWLETFESFISK
jgi:complement component 1 Q subcomponent-binding protein